MSNIALEFGSNLFGKLKPDIKNRLQNVINFPSQKSWENTHTIILNKKRFTTLWQAVCKVDPTFQITRRSGKDWDRIPSKKILIKAINTAVFKGDTKEDLN